MNDVKSLGTIMGLWAHPDDETFVAGGLLAQAAQNGQTVVCVTATRGESGVYDPLRWPTSDIGAIRAVELTDALRILGVKHHHWMHYKDGFCHQAPDATAVSELMPIIERYQPDTIVTFPPNGMTGHQDHQAVSRWAFKAAEWSARPMKVLYGVDSKTAYNQYLKLMDEKLNIYFNIDEPDLYERSECDMVLRLSEQVLGQKCAALKAMPSQTFRMLKEFPFDYICKAFAEEQYVFAGNEHNKNGY